MLRAFLGPAFAALLISVPAFAAGKDGPPRPPDAATAAPEAGGPGNRDPAGAVTAKLAAALRLIDQGLIMDALYALQYDVLPRIDGCAAQGAPDRDDWITSCDAQAPLYRRVIDKIEELETL